MPSFAAREGARATSSISDTASCRQHRSSTCRCWPITSTPPRGDSAEPGSVNVSVPDHGVLDVAIVGAGLAGLAAAFDLRARGRTVRVLEATSRPGGVIATERFDGWTIDGGPDSLLVQKPAAVTLCRELGIADRLVPTLMPRTA